MYEEGWCKASFLNEKGGILLQRIKKFICFYKSIEKLITEIIS